MNQIILDECHKAKNLVPTGSGKPTKTGITVLQLQDLLPKARVVYCSATGWFIFVHAASRSSLLFLSPINFSAIVLAFSGHSGMNESHYSI